MIRHQKKIITAGLAVAILLDLGSLAPAQVNRSAASARALSAETTGQSATPQASPSPMHAPVGHLQPSPRELPGLTNEDISRTREQIDFDKSLRICKGC